MLSGRTGGGKGDPQQGAVISVGRERIMGKIISFPVAASRKRAKKTTAGDPAQCARIILFPGVRYEYVDPENLRNAASHKKKA